MFHYIINPSTNKKISLYSSEGKQLLKKYVQLLNAGNGGSTRTNTYSSYSSRPISFVNLTDTNYSYNNQMQSYVFNGS